MIQHYLANGAQTQVSFFCTGYPPPPGGGAARPSTLFYHNTYLQNLRGILERSLETGPGGDNAAGVFTHGEESFCDAYGDVVTVLCDAVGMLWKIPTGDKGRRELKLRDGERYPIPAGVMGFFDSNGKRQYVHNQRSVEVRYILVDYDPLVALLAEAFIRVGHGIPYTKELHENGMGACSRCMHVRMR